MPGSRPADPPSALVTGGSRGIGRVIALRMAQSAPVVINYRQAREEADEVVRAIRGRGGTAAALQADLSVPGAARRLFAEAEQTLGPVGTLINNAGATRDRLLLQMSVEDWDFCWDTNLTGARALARVAVDAMCSRGAGRIVNVGSVVGSAGNIGQANYASAKSALFGLTRELAVMAAPHGVTVNCVVPGYIDTDATAHLSEAQRERWLSRIPMQRYARPEEVGDLVVFLAGAGAGYITGQCIAVDGGFLAAAGAGITS